jgi:DNA-binding NarL/FixJ family response regulator
MRVVIADDAALLRESLADALTHRGIEVVGRASDAAGLLRSVETTTPDLVIVDIRMPPTYTDEGLVVARRLRAERPGLPILVLSHHVESATALGLIRDDPAGIGYLLKDRISHLDELVSALERLVAGGSVIDPEVVAGLLGRRRGGPLDELTAREREVMGLMAEGRSNRGIAEVLGVEEKTVEYHVGQIFGKLGLELGPNDHRRVLAVLSWREDGGRTA